MSNLLQVVRFKTEAVKRKALPLMLEFKVNAECAPYLVSSSHGLVWVEQAHPGDIIKAAVREIRSPGDVFEEAVRTIAVEGRAREWGNVHPYTQDGLQAAVSHLESYDFDDLEILTRPVGKTVPWLQADALGGVPVRHTAWVPKGWLVVVPKDREFVGLLGHLTTRQVVAAIHNPSRGVAILHPSLKAGPVPTEPSKPTVPSKPTSAVTKLDVT